MKFSKRNIQRILNSPVTYAVCGVVSLTSILYSGWTTYDIARGLTPGQRHYIQTDPIKPDGLEIEIPTDAEPEFSLPETEDFSTFTTDDVLLLPEQAPSGESQTEAPETEITEPESTQKPQQSQGTTKPPASTTKPPETTTKPQTSQKPAETTKPQSKPVTGWSVTYAQAKKMVKADSAYDYEDLYWLSRIISAEARGESFTGQIGVGTVVLNRVKSKQFPNTVKGVVFDRKYGTQFTPVANGSIYNAPTQSAIVAAKMCLDGYTLSDSVLYFLNPTIATSSWIQNNRKYAFKVGNHEFYH